MKITKISLVLVSIACLATAASCIEDESKYGGLDLPTLSVDVPDSDEMPQININYGEECVITPQINYSGSKELTYAWSVGTYDNELKGELQTVSNDKVLTYKFPKGGVYFAHLNVTDGVVGLAQDYRINVNRTFESGWVIISNNDKGVGNLAFIKDLTPEEIAAGTPQILIEHGLEMVNENIGGDYLAGGLTIQLTWPKTATKIFVSTGSKGCFLDPNTFVAQTETDLASVVPGFSATHVFGAAQNPRVFDEKLGAYITFNGNDMFGYVESAWAGHSYDAAACGTYMSWGNLNYDYAYYNRKPLEIAAYSPYFYSDDHFMSSRDIELDGKPLFDNEELVVAFMGESKSEYIEAWDYWSSYYPFYFITRDVNDGQYFVSHIKDFGSYSMEFSLVYHNELAVDANTAIPQTESDVVPSETYHRNYFHDGSKVYVMLMENDNLILPSKSQACLDFGDEEITFMSINSSTDELIIATATKGTGRGNVYMYNVAEVRTDNPGATPKAVYKDCADRISNIFYKPRVTNV